MPFVIEEKKNKQTHWIELFIFKNKSNKLHGLATMNIKFNSESSRLMCYMQKLSINTLISFPDFSFPANISSRKLSTILMVIFGPKSDTSRAWN